LLSYLSNSPLEALGRIELPYGRISWQSKEDFRNVDILAKLHEAWGTEELMSQRLLDSDGMVQEFEYPDGKISIDLYVSAISRS
jgi:hypothetical protein